MSILHVVCSWCRGVITQGDETQPISHGICPPCGIKFRAGR